MEWIDHCRGRIFDLVHGVDTGRKMAINDLHVIGENKQFGMAYHATSRHSFGGSKAVTP